MLGDIKDRRLWCARVLGREDDRLGQLVSAVRELDEYADYDLLTDNSYAQAAYKTVYSR